MLVEDRLVIACDTDVVIARSRAKEFAASLGFSRTDQTVIATAVSEVARNIVVYATSGEIRIRNERRDGRLGLVVVAQDKGPGIADIEQALTDGYSTTGSLGVGLPGARRLMDILLVESEVGLGTTVTMVKWADPGG